MKYDVKFTSQFKKDLKLAGTEETVENAHVNQLL